LFLCYSIQIVQIVDKSHFPAVITHVSAGKQAAIAGVLPGMHIHAVNGKECRDKPLKWVVAMIKQKKSSGEPLSLTLEQDDPPQDVEVDDPNGIPHTISNWTLSRAGSTNPEDEDDYVELIAPDQTIVDWPARAMPKGVPAGSRLKFEVSVISGPQRTEVVDVTFDKGKLGLGLDQDSDGFSGAMISSVAKGGKAEATGNVHIGDLLLEVNGTRVSDKQFSEIMDKIKEVGRPLILKLKPRPWITEIFKAEQQVIEHIVKPKASSRSPSAPTNSVFGGSGKGGFGKLRNPKSKFLKFGKMGFSDMVSSAVLTEKFTKHAEVHAKTSRVKMIETQKRKIAARKKLERRIATRMGKPLPTDKAKKTHANL
jgi:hypothetical protein